MPRQPKDLTGHISGRLTVLRSEGRDTRGILLWRCRCECGTECVKRGADLAYSKVKSCGCGHRGGKITHGQSDSPLYTRWLNMRQRTSNPNRADYARYGGRGVTVCAEWRESFEAFAHDMGPGFSPDLTLERVDNTRGYEPGNCRWATHVEQNRNRRSSRLLEFRGQTKSLVEWVELLGLRYHTVKARLSRLGWSVERALTTGADPSALAQLDADRRAAQAADSKTSQ